MIKRVTIVGGTHGNELTGVHLLRHWQRQPEQVARESFETQLLLANPAAVELNRRFVDKDLNRCFGLDDLRGAKTAQLEVQRAREIEQLLGPKGESAQCDFLIDMHSSTSHCGAMIILTRLGEFNVRLAAYLQQQVSSAQVVYYPQEDGDSPYMGSLCQRALGVEVGPVGQGVLQHQAMALTECLVQLALDFAEMENAGVVCPLPDEMTVLRFKSVIKYPMQDGQISAVVHRDLQDSDYKPLRRGQFLFYSFDGESVSYEGEQGLIPVFINEAAYYPDAVAVTLTERFSVKIP